MTESKTPRQWFYPRPNWVLFAIVAVAGLLLFSAPEGWFGFNADKVSALVIGLAAIIVDAVVVTLLLIILCYVAIVLWAVARWGHRRRFQYNLRSLLVLTLVVSIGMSWIATKRQWATRQRKAAEKIEQR